MDTAADPRDELVSELVALRSVVNAAEARSAEIVATLEALDEGHPLGCRTTTQFLAWQAGLAAGAAKAVAETGRAFASLPSLRTAAIAGEVSVWEARAIASTAVDDAEATGLLEIARHGTCSQLESACRRLRKVRRADGDADAAAHRARRCRTWWTTGGTFRLDAELGAEAGALVATALEEAAEQVPEDAATDADDPAAARHADGLELVARRFLGSAALDGDSASPPAGQLSVHIGLPALTGDAVADGVDPTLAEVCRLGWQGVGVSDVLARRLGCDTTLQAVIRDPDGNPLALGRTRRVVNRRLRRALHERDQRCRGPNCDATRHLVAHHIVHWVDGGPTDLENLVLVCAWHHRMVHDGQLAVRMVDGRAVIAPPGDPPPGGPRRPHITGDPRAAASRRGVDPSPGAAASRWDGSHIDWWCFEAAYCNPEDDGRREFDDSCGADDPPDEQRAA